MFGSQYQAASGGHGPPHQQRPALSSSSSSLGGLPDSSQQQAHQAHQGTAYARTDEILATVPAVSAVGSSTSAASCQEASCVPQVAGTSQQAMCNNSAASATGVKRHASCSNHSKQRFDRSWVTALSFLILLSSCGWLPAAAAAGDSSCHGQHGSTSSRHLAASSSNSIDQAVLDVSARSRPSYSRASSISPSSRKLRSGTGSSRSSNSSSSWRLLGPWERLAIRSRRATAAVNALPLLLSAAMEDDHAAAKEAAQAAAESAGRAFRLLLTDLQLESDSSGSRTSSGKASSGNSNSRANPPRYLAKATQGPAGTPSGGSSAPVQSSDAGFQSLCSATINYGASVGDASKKGTADVPIYVGSFDIVVAQNQAGSSAAKSNSSWVLGWQFAAGEYLQMSRDVFGDDGIYSVFTSPSMDQQPGATDTPAGPVPGAALGKPGSPPQHVAVFSNSSLGGPNNEVLFSFVGRKGPEQPPNPMAPFRVAPPTYVFLNNHYCWPLFRPSANAGSGSAAVAAASAAANPVRGAADSSTAGQDDQSSQQQLVEVASPKLAVADMPKQVVAEYLPVEFQPESVDPALFTKTVTQFYFKVTNAARDPFYLDQLLLQYWFQGPFEATDSAALAASSSNTSSSAGSTGGNDVADVVARVSASQFRLTCSDASPQIGCGGLAWNVTPGLPGVFGARYVLNIWFPSPASNGSSRTNSSLPDRFLLLPNPGSSNSSKSSTFSASDLQLRVVAGPGGAVTRVQPITDVQAIVAIEPRRFFANISATNDYSFLETPLQQSDQANSNSSSSSDGGGGQLVRRKREPNTRLPVYVSQKLAWGSPPIGGAYAPRSSLTGGSNASSGSAPKSSFPPGSYCQPSPGGGLVCGIDVLYCCLGSTPLNLTAIPSDWPQRLASGSSPAAAADMAAQAAPLGLTGINGNGSSTGGAAPPGPKPAVQPWGIALAVVLPVAALAAAVAALLTWRQRRGSVRRRLTADSGTQQHLQPSLGGSSTDGSQGDGGSGGMVALDFTGAAGLDGKHAGQQQLSQGQDNSLLTALLTAHHGSRQGSSERVGLLRQPGGTHFTPTEAAAAADLDAVERGLAAPVAGPAGLQLQQQLAELQLLHHQQQQQHQLHGNSAVAGHSHQTGTLMMASQYAAAHPASMQDHAAAKPLVLRLLKPKAASVPADVIAAAIRFVKQQQLQPRGSNGSSSQPSSPFARARVQHAGQWPAFGRSGSGRNRSSTDSQGSIGDAVARCNTWTGRLHDDAFNDDLLDQLINLHMRPPPLLTSPTAAAVTAAADYTLPPTTEGAWQQVQQQQQQHHQQPQQQAGAAAAAVEAAITAINALMTGSVPQGPGCPTGSAQGTTSFYRALMATGGMIRPPGGPPIPLNVDYATEIQPNLGRLLGKGGFGHVYEATWRGQKVAVKLLTVDTDDAAVLDAFLKEVALCACLRGCDRVVRLLGACLGGCGTRKPHTPPYTPGPAASHAFGPTAHGGSTSTASSSSDRGIAAAAAAAAGASSEGLDLHAAVPSADTPTPFQSQLPPDIFGEDALQTGSAGGLAGGPGPGLVDGGQGRQQQQPQQQQLALIMELVEGGNLAHRIYSPSKRRLSYLEILQIGLDVASGLAYLHPAVVHRDLKPQNVLLDKQGRAKIADFGISRFKDPHRSYLSVTHQGGTPNYMAPELFNASRVDETADVYSLGCILYECLARRQPFGHLAEDAKSFNVLFKIIVAVAINKERPQLPSDTPPRLASLIIRCWLEEPAARPRVQQVLEELQDMMREELQARSEKIRRLSRVSTRTQSLPNQAMHDISISRTGSNASSISTGPPGPLKPPGPVRGAVTLPLSATPAPFEGSNVIGASDSSGSSEPGPVEHAGAEGMLGMSAAARGLQRAGSSPTAAASVRDPVKHSAALFHSQGVSPVLAGSASGDGFGSHSSSSKDGSSTGAPYSAQEISLSSMLAVPPTAAAAALLSAGDGSTRHPYHQQHLDQQQLHEQPSRMAVGQQQQQQHQQHQLGSGQPTSHTSSHSREDWDCSYMDCACCGGSSSSIAASSHGPCCNGSDGCGSYSSSPKPQLVRDQQLPELSAAGLPVLPLQLTAGAAAAPGCAGSVPASQPLGTKLSYGPLAPPTPAGAARAGRKASRHSHTSSILSDTGLSATGLVHASSSEQYVHPSASAAFAGLAMPHPGLVRQYSAAAAEAGVPRQPYGGLLRQQSAVPTPAYAGLIRQASVAGEASLHRQGSQGSQGQNLPGRADRQAAAAILNGCTTHTSAPQQLLQQQTRALPRPQPSYQLQHGVDSSEELSPQVSIGAESVGYSSGQGSNSSSPVCKPAYRAAAQQRGQLPISSSGGSSSPSSRCADDSADLSQLQLLHRSVSCISSISDSPAGQPGTATTGLADASVGGVGGASLDASYGSGQTEQFEASSASSVASRIPATSDYSSSMYSSGGALSYRANSNASSASVGSKTRHDAAGAAAAVRPLPLPPGYSAAAQAPPANASRTSSATNSSSFVTACTQFYASAWAGSGASATSLYGNINSSTAGAAARSVGEFSMHASRCVSDPGPADHTSLLYQQQVSAAASHPLPAGQSSEAAKQQSTGPAPDAVPTASPAPPASPSGSDVGANGGQGGRIVQRKVSFADAYEVIS